MDKETAATETNEDNEIAKTQAAKDLCAKAVGKVLEDYNCLPQESMICTQKGNFPIVSIMPNLVTGEQEEDRKTRAEKCAASIKDIMLEHNFDWHVSSTLQKNRAPVLHLDIIQLPKSEESTEKEKPSDPK